MLPVGAHLPVDDRADNVRPVAQIRRRGATKRGGAGHAVARGGARLSTHPGRGRPSGIGLFSAAGGRRSLIVMRFAFYGRVSTEDQQDPASSRGWQIARSRQVIEPAGGEIACEFFDVGQSRSLPWKRRPESARLLEAFKDSNRGFDAVVIGEPQRAFYGNQFGLTFPVFVHYGVQLWVPEVGGAVDPGSEAHDLVMSLYGGMSKGERSRIKTRVRSAMASQAAVEGRFLGGRPPYGYRLVDAGPHPNPGKAAIGQRLHRLEPDPATAPVVRRIFSRFLDGDGLHRIAVDLTADGILSPSGYDPTRNPHRASSAGLWGKSAVRAILANPRYTGHQVWNRQRRDEVLLDVDDVGLGHETKMRWNDKSEWVWSDSQVQEPLIETTTFETVQERFGRTTSAARRTPTAGRSYVLAGLMRCGICDRRMGGQWNHGRAYYRCRFPLDYPVDEQEHPKSIYIKEDAIVPALDRWVAELFDDDRIDDTCATLAGASEPDPEHAAREADIQSKIRDCDRRIEKYKKALDLTDEVGPFIGWIAEAQKERRTLEAQLRRTVPSGELTTEQVKTLVRHLRDIVAVLASAAPADKAELYRELGIELTYHADRGVKVEALPRGTAVGVGGGT